MDSRPPSILMLCTVFSMEETSRSLLRELADALAGCGARMQICVIDWSGPVGAETRLEILPNGIEVLIVAPWAITGLGKLAANATKWIGSSFFAMRAIRRHFGDRRIDLLLDFSPLIVTTWPIIWAKRLFGCRGYAYLTDFFPFHQRGAGQKIGGRIAFKIGVLLETFLMRHFETIGCMSPAGLDFIRQHYALKPSQRLRLLHLWGDTTLPARQDPNALRAAYDLPAERPIILFGGQIAEGRGIEELIEVAARARRVRPDLMFLFMGKGRLESLIQAQIDAGGDNVMLKAPVSRERYLALVTACDIGVVSTVANTGVPSFPSKTIDYLRAGIPVVASVEDTTDYGEFVEGNGFGVAIVAGNPDAFLAALLRVLEDPHARENMAANGRQALSQYFDVNAAARAILDQAFEADRATRPPEGS